VNAGALDADLLRKFAKAQGVVTARLHHRASGIHDRLLGIGHDGGTPSIYR
jgi:hypothetical protein